MLSLLCDGGLHQTLLFLGFFHKISEVCSPHVRAEMMCAHKRKENFLWSRGTSLSPSLCYYLMKVETYMQTCRVLAVVKMIELLSSFRNCLHSVTPHSRKTNCSLEIIKFCAETVGTQRFHSRPPVNCLSFQSASGTFISNAPC